MLHWTFLLWVSIMPQINDLPLGAVQKVAYSDLTEEALNAQFMPRIAVPDHENWINEDLAASSALRREFAAAGRAQLDRRYGPGPRQLLDIFPADRPGAPILIWMHGGYWRALSKEHYTSIAPTFVAAGAAVVLVGYDLCPSLTLTDLLAETRAAIRWVSVHAAEMHGDASRLFLAGNSAGAHICAMALQHDWSADEVSTDSIRGAALITGIYDLSPVPRLPVQAEVRLTQKEVEALSPLHLPIRSQAPAIVAVGADEPDLWIAQSRDYARKLERAAVPHQLMVIPGRHHFSITRDLTDPSTDLARAIVDLLNS